MAIREDEWLQELDRLSRRHVDGFTTADICASTGMSPRNVRTKLAEGMRLGLVVFAGHRTGTSIDGKGCRVPVYRKAAKKKARR